MGMGMMRMGGMIVGLRFDFDFFQIRWIFRPVGCWFLLVSLLLCTVSHRLTVLPLPNAAKQTRTVRDSTEQRKREEGEKRREGGEWKGRRARRAS